MTVAEFLLARIAEDETAAQYALKYAVGGDDSDHQWKWVHIYKLKDRQHGWSSSHHDGSPSPARVLAECEAKRRIVERYQEFVFIGERQDVPMDSEAYEYRDILSLLALPYADHPDYQQEWKVAE